MFVWSVGGAERRCRDDRKLTCALPFTLDSQPSYNEEKVLTISFVSVDVSRTLKDLPLLPDSPTPRFLEELINALAIRPSWQRPGSESSKWL